MATVIPKNRRKTMFTETRKDRDDVIGIVCEGKLGEGDLERMHALLH